MNNPPLIATPFAENGDKNTIPESVPLAPQNATLEKGFPLITQQKISEGGIPPERLDFNGALNLITQHTVFLNKGGRYGFDAEFAAKIGGYEKGACLTLDDGTQVISEIDANTNDPNINLTGWVFLKINASAVVDSSGATQQAINNEVVNVDRYYNGSLSDALSAIKAKMTTPYILQFGQNKSYILTTPFELNDLITGIDLNSCQITYTYEQPPSASTQTKASLFVQFDRTKPFFMKNGKLRYTGTFDTGASYTGMVSGLDIRATAEFSGIFIDNVEASGFNSDGVVINQFQTGWKYTTQVAVRNCNFHHNRVSGVRYGFVDGFLLHGCELKYNGLDSDIGTGYGSAGISNALPKNCVISSNNASNNFRKGIDHHSGYNVIVSNNICQANKQYGIFLSARNHFNNINNPTGTYMIVDNIVCDMYAPVGTNIPDMLGITIGKDATSIKDESDSKVSLIVRGNTITNFSSDSVQADAIRVLPDFANCDIEVSNNNITGTNISNAIGFYPSNKSTISERVTLRVIGNNFKIPRLLNGLIHFRPQVSVNNMIFSNNIITVEFVPSVQIWSNFLDQTTPQSDTLRSAIYSNNIINSTTFVVRTDLFVNNGSQQVESVGNVLNGRVWRNYKQGVYTHHAANTTQDIAITWTRGSIIYNNTANIGEPAYWICSATGTGNAQFRPCGIIGNGLVAENVLLADLQSATSSINTVGKTTGKIIYNRADGKPYISIGLTPTAAWRAMDGSGDITPA